MADQKISELTAQTTLDDTSDVFPVVDVSAGATEKITWGNLQTAIGGYIDDATLTLTNKTISRASNTMSAAADIIVGTNGDYTDIQDALDNSSGGKTIYVEDGTYTITSTLLFKYDRTRLIVSDGATIQCDGAVLSTLIAWDTNVDSCSLIGGYWHNSGTDGNGTGIDMSNTSNNYVAPNKVDDFAVGIKLSDTSDLTFYNYIERANIFDCTTCIELSGSMANNNTFNAVRCRPLTGGAGYGIYLSHARGNVFTGCNVEPGGVGGGNDITGIYLRSADSSTRTKDNTFVNCWIENPEVTVLIDADSFNNNFIGCTLVGGGNESGVGAGGPDFTDNSPFGANRFIGCNPDSSSAFFNVIGTITDRNRNEIVSFGETAAAVNDITITNNSTGGLPKIAASGETNIGLLLTGKGTGKVSIGDAVDNTKLVRFETVNATTGTRTQLDFAQTANRTITFPDLTTTLVGSDETSATDNSIARFDGTSGKLIQDTGAAATINDTGTMSTQFYVATSDGIASFASFSFSGDNDTGVWSPADNTVGLQAGGVTAARFNTATTGVNYLDITPSATTAPVLIAPAGSDTNISLSLQPKGSGSVVLGNLTGVLRADSGVVSTDSDVTDLVTTATSSAQGKVELAIASEINTGTDTDRAVTPDALAGSNLGTKNVAIQVIDAATALTTGDGKAYFRIPIELNGMNVVSSAVAVNTTSSSGNPTVMLARGRQSGPTSAHSYVDILSTALTIDATEYDSKDATTAAVINTSNDDVATGDLIRIDVDAAGTNTAGLIVTVGFRLP